MFTCVRVSKVLAIYTCTYVHIIQVRGIVRRPRPLYKLHSAKGCGWGKAYELSSIGSYWGIVLGGGPPPRAMLVGSHGAQKPAPAPSPPRQGAKTFPILFSISQKKDSGPPRNAIQKLEKIHSALQGGNGQDWLHLGTLKRVHTQCRPSCRQVVCSLPKKEREKRIIPQRTFQNVRSGRPPVPTERTKPLNICLPQKGKARLPTIISPGGKLAGTRKIPNLENEIFNFQALQSQNYLGKFNHPIIRSPLQQGAIQTSGLSPHLIRSDKQLYS